MAKNPINVISCRGAVKFTSLIFEHLKAANSKAKMINTEFVTFANGEIKCTINESVRGNDVFIVQDVTNESIGSINDNIVELLATIDAVNHASAEEVNLVLPTFPYARQHKKKGREGLTAAMWCHIMENMGVRRIITLDIHSREIQNAFSHTIMENLHASYYLVKAMKEDGVDFNNLIVVSPDSGAVERNKYFAVNLKRPLAVIYKERDYSKSGNDNIVDMKLIGDIDHAPILITDDMIDTAGTLLKACTFLKEKGAGSIYIAASLAFLNGDAMINIEEAQDKEIITKIYTTNATYRTDNIIKDSNLYVIADVSELFAQSMIHINNGTSLSNVLESADNIKRLLGS